MHKEKKTLFSKKNMMSLFIVFIMATSIMGYMWGRDSSNGFDYHGNSFERKGNYWVLKKDSQQYQFHYFPSELEDINLSEDILSRVKDTVEIDSTSDANDTNIQAIALAQYEMKQVLDKQNVYLRAGFTGDNKYNISAITCDDATFNVPVIYFKTANQTNVMLQGNCIVAEAKNAAEFIRIEEVIVYSILGVLNG